jgi:hypothetical protein
MARIGGNPDLRGNKNSGRKSKDDEFKDCKELIKQEALIELANEIGYKKLQKMAKTSPKAQEIKDLVMPIILKGMTEKIDHTTKGEKISGFNYVKPDDANDKTAA